MSGLYYSSIIIFWKYDESSCLISIKKWPLGRCIIDFSLGWTDIELLINLPEISNILALKKPVVVLFKKISPLDGIG